MQNMYILYGQNAKKLIKTFVVINLISTLNSFCSRLISSLIFWNFSQTKLFEKSYRGQRSAMHFDFD